MASSGTKQKVVGIHGSDSKIPPPSKTLAPSRQRKHEKNRLILENKIRMEEELREKQARESRSWALKATQAAIAVLCGYDNAFGSQRRYSFYTCDRIDFPQLAAEIFKANAGNDMRDFFKVMGRVNTSEEKRLPDQDILPLLRILDGLNTSFYNRSYDDSDEGCYWDCGCSQAQTNSVLTKLTFKDLIGLSAYLTEHGFKDLGVQISESTVFAESDPKQYTDNQYASALRHVIAIIISAAKATGEDMTGSGTFFEWFGKLKNDPTGWWATNEFVQSMTKRVDEMMYARSRRMLREGLEDYYKKMQGN